MLATVKDAKSSTVVDILQERTSHPDTQHLGGVLVAGNDRVNAFVSTSSLFVPSGAASGVSRVAPVATKGGMNAFAYTKSAAKHFAEPVKHGVNKGQLARPYMKSPLTIQEIMSTGKGIPDTTFKGGLNWRVPGTFRGSQGIWELGINPETNVIYHFNFR